MLYIESHTTTKKSIVPVFDCPSVVAVGNTSTSLNTNSLQFQQLIEDTDREEVPSELRVMPDGYMSYIMACLSIQCRFLPLLLKDKDVLLDFYKLLLGSKDCGVFSPIRIMTLPNRAMISISNALKGMRCICGDFPLLKSCILDLKAKAASSTSESLFLCSTLLWLVCCHQTPHFALNTLDKKRCTTAASLLNSVIIRPTNSFLLTSSFAILNVPVTTSCTSSSPPLNALSTSSRPLTASHKEERLTFHTDCKNSYAKTQNGKDESSVWCSADVTGATGATAAAMGTKHNKHNTTPNTSSTRTRNPSFASFSNAVSTNPCTASLFAGAPICRTAASTTARRIPFVVVPLALLTRLRIASTLASCSKRFWASSLDTSSNPNSLVHSFSFSHTHDDG